MASLNTVDKLGGASIREGRGLGAVLSRSADKDTYDDYKVPSLYLVPSASN